MKDWSLILLIAAIDGLACTASSADPSAHIELAYQGKPLTYWLTALEPGRSASAVPKEAEAEEAIHALGPDAVPLILQYRHGDRAQRLDVIRHACSVLEPDADLKLIEAVHDADAAIRETALEVLPKTLTAVAIDDVIKSLADPVRTVRNAAILALVRLAPDREETIAALIESLQTGDEVADKASHSFSREDAVLTLAALGPKAKAAVPELTKLLDDSNDDVREAAATALWKIEQNTSGVSVLVDRLENARDYQTYVRVVKLLGEIGTPAKPAVPVIQKKIDDPGLSFVPPTVDLGQIALTALAKIDPQAAAQARKKLGASSGDNR